MASSGTIRLRHALAITGVFAGFIGLCGFAITSLQERVSTCETQVSQIQLQYVIGAQELASYQTMIAQQAISKQISEATGKAGPYSAEFVNVANKAKTLIGALDGMNHRMEAALNNSCDEQRSDFYAFSLLLVLLNAVAASLALYFGIKATHA